MEKRRWMPHEDQYLRDHCDDTSIHDIAKTLNRSLNAVYTRKVKLGLTGRQRPWTEADKSFLDENDHLSNEELAAQLDRSVDDVSAMRRRLEGGHKHPHWKPAEEEYLQDRWGNWSYMCIMAPSSTRAGRASSGSVWPPRRTVRRMPRRQRICWSVWAWLI